MDLHRTPTEVASTLRVGASGGFGSRGSVPVVQHAGMSLFMADTKATASARSSLDRHAVATHSFSQQQGALTRNLVNESHVVFEAVQATVADPQLDRMDPNDALALSVQYRSVLQSCTVAARDAIMQGKQDATGSNYQDQQTHFAIMDFMWHLCEVMFLRPSAHLRAGLVLNDLLEWVTSHFVEFEDRVHQLAQPTVSQPETNPFYWEALERLLLQGQLKRAQEVLGIHSQRRPDGNDEFGMVDELLRSMPRMFPGGSTSEFTNIWHEWHQSCDLCYRNIQNPHLRTLCGILSADLTVLASMSDRAETWYQLLVAKILYTSPLARVFDLQGDIQWAREQYAGFEVGPLDQMILAVFDQDAPKVIRDSCECFNDWWFAAHMADLLSWTGWLQSHADTPDLREYLVLDYASGLCASSSLWTVAASYFMSCPREGRAYLEEYIMRVPLESEFKARKVLRVCQLCGLDYQSRRIALVMGRQCLSQGRPGAAIGWYLRAHDTAAVDRIAEQMLQEYIETGDFDPAGVVDNFGAAMLSSERLTFLVKYKEFLVLRNTPGKLEQAGAVLVNILTTEHMAPKWFCLTLLVDALPLLEHPTLVFDTEQTHFLLHSLQALESSHRHADYLGYSRPKQKQLHQQQAQQPLKSEGAKKLELLRLALGRNLARAMLQ
eukprot:m.53549 g.53549  ORF g.53549 m.53549 type:complete len:664 (+) comp12391_c0_seq2:96-2087(+)